MRSVILFVVLLMSYGFSQTQLVEVFVVDKVDTASIVLVGTNSVKLNTGLIVSRDEIVGDVPEIGTILQKIHTGYATISGQLETGFRESEIIDINSWNSVLSNSTIVVERTNTSIFVSGHGKSYSAFFLPVDKDQLVLRSKIFNRNLIVGDNERMDLPAILVVIDELYFCNR